MIKIAICDDENVIVNQIEGMILKVCNLQGIPIEIDAFYSGNALEKEIQQGAQYDLIYLDIQMENGDGITAAENIRKIDENVLLIYVSGHDKYVMRLFRLDVFAFIKKPINEEIFAKTFLEANQKISNKMFYFRFGYKKNEHKVQCKEILYFESRGRKINIYLRNGQVEVFNGKLSEVEDQLSEGKIPFMRIHQSYLVNYFFIKSRSKADITLINGKKLPISEERKKNFGEEYSRLLGGEIDV